MDNCWCRRQVNKLPAGRSLSGTARRQDGQPPGHLYYWLYRMNLSVLLCPASYSARRRSFAAGREPVQARSAAAHTCQTADCSALIEWRAPRDIRRPGRRSAARRRVPLYTCMRPNDATHSIGARGPVNCRTGSWPVRLTCVAGSLRGRVAAAELGRSEWSGARPRAGPGNGRRREASECLPASTWRCLPRGRHRRADSCERSSAIRADASASAAADSKGVRASASECVPASRETAARR